MSRFLDEAEHLSHNQNTSVTSLRLLFGFTPKSCSPCLRIAVRLGRNRQSAAGHPNSATPAGVGVELQRGAPEPARPAISNFELAGKSARNNAAAPLRGRGRLISVPTDRYRFVRHSSPTPVAIQAPPPPINSSATGQARRNLQPIPACPSPTAAGSRTRPALFR